MVTTVRSLGLQGISGYEVTVECFLSGGLPAFDVVGLGDTAVKEARERVRAAIAGGIRVFDAEDEGSSRVTGVGPIEQARADHADVRGSCGRGAEADANVGTGGSCFTHDSPILLQGWLLHLLDGRARCDARRARGYAGCMTGIGLAASAATRWRTPCPFNSFPTPTSTAPAP